MPGSMGQMESNAKVQSDLSKSEGGDNFPMFAHWSHDQQPPPARADNYMGYELRPISANVPRSQGLKVLLNNYK